MSPELVLIDTSIWLLALGPSARPQIRQRVEDLIDERRVAIAPMIMLEILGGMPAKEEFVRLKSRLDSLRQLEAGPIEWEDAARMSFRLRRAGKTIPNMDILIASVAIRSNALLFHADRHFQIVAENTGLMQESVLPLSHNP